MTAYPREELERMVAAWTDANERAEATGNWIDTLGAFYTDDARYEYQLGPDEVFAVVGPDEIKATVIGEQMEGFEEWRYPFVRTLIDETKGEVVIFWEQISPHRRPDGTPYKVAGVGGSRFVYGGDMKWSFQEDFFDFACTIALFTELAAEGLLHPKVKAKMRKVALGQSMRGHAPYRYKLSPLTQLRGKLALARVVLFGG